MDYEAQYDKIYRYCYYKVKNRALAEDITQEAFLRLLNFGRSGQHLKPVRESEPRAQDELTGFRTGALNESRPKATNAFHAAGEEVRYLYTIAHHLCIDEYRRKKAEPWEAVPETIADRKQAPDETAIRKYDLERAMEKLTEEDREILLLKFVNEEKDSVICRMYGMSRFSLYRRLRRLKAFLQQQLS